MISAPESRLLLVAVLLALLSACGPAKVEVEGTFPEPLMEPLPLTIDERVQRLESLPLNSLPRRDGCDPSWVRIRTVMDSGAAESVAPSKRGPRGPH